MEEAPKFNNDKEDLFRKDWEKRANDWVREIRISGLPDEYCQDLEMIIEKMFLESYISKDPKKNLARNDKELSIFLESFQSELDKIPDHFATTKTTLLDMVKKDISLLYTAKYN
jgi:hypothetical protein